MKRWGNELDHVVSVRFDRRLLDSVRGLADADGVSVSDWFRAAARREDEKRRRETAQAATAEVLGGWPVRPRDLVPGSGRLGASRSLPSSLNTNGGQGRTFSCQHMSIGNVVSAECWICGPLMAVA